VQSIFGPMLGKWSTFVGVQRIALRNGMGNCQEEMSWNLPEQHSTLSVIHMQM